MTHEEAIRILCAINVPEGHTTIIDKNTNIALDMAIQALSKGLDCEKEINLITQGKK